MQGQSPTDLRVYKLSRVERNVPAAKPSVLLVKRLLTVFVVRWCREIAGHVQRVGYAPPCCLNLYRGAACSWAFCGLNFRGRWLLCAGRPSLPPDQASGATTVAVFCRPSTQFVYRSVQQRLKLALCETWKLWRASSACATLRSRAAWPHRCRCVCLPPAFSALGRRGQLRCDGFSGTSPARVVRRRASASAGATDAHRQILCPALGIALASDLRLGLQVVGPLEFRTGAAQRERCCRAGVVLLVLVSRPRKLMNGPTGCGFWTRWPKCSSSSWARAENPRRSRRAQRMVASSPAQFGGLRQEPR
jgi:hypothetical protein